MQRNLKPALFVTLALAMIFTAGCAGSRAKKKFAYVERPVEQLYSDATNRLERKRYAEAIAYFEEVERQHPYSSWARRAMLMKAFTYYQDNKYDESIAAIDQFIALHPGNKDAPYAHYLKAMTYYERIRDVGRDQDYTNNAVAALTDVVRRYPASEYARDARLKLDLTFDHLAGKEMYVGRYYLKQKKHIAAINRFKHVVNNYQTTNHVPEALHRLVESYVQIGIIDEARAAAAVLGHNYPGSRWYEDSYALIERFDLLNPQARRTTAKAEPASVGEAPQLGPNPLDPGLAEAPPPPVQSEDLSSSADNSSGDETKG